MTVPKVVYVRSDGTERAIDAPSGESVMRVAVDNDVPGIIGECGGNLSCATCHVWVRDEFLAAVGSPGEFEDDILELGVEDRRPGSRLSCQITISADLDGLTVDVPPEHDE
jgi:2Fe-2S ferredoxin